MGSITKVEWTKEKEGRIKGPILPAVSVVAPPEFKGREGQWTPEHLFVAGVSLPSWLSPRLRRSPFNKKSE
jgi:organic hydroperoxide reductase OsmC/OhrA